MTVPPQDPNRDPRNPNRPQNPNWPPQNPNQGQNFQQFPGQQQPGSQPPGGQVPLNPYVNDPNLYARVERREKLKSHRGLIIGIAIAVVLLIVAVIAGIGIWRAVTPTPKKTVEQYFAALEDKDAGKAKSYLSEQVLKGKSEKLLTNEVLNSALSSAPISDVEVESVKNDDSSVKATYKLGDEEKTETIKVVKDDKGDYKVNSMADVRFGSVAGGAQLTVNGVAVDDGIVLVFPGKYQVGTTNDFFNVKDPEFTATATRAASSAVVVLSDNAQQTMRDAVKAKIEECKTKTGFDEIECGWRFHKKVKDSDEEVVSANCQPEGVESIDQAEFKWNRGTEAAASFEMTWQCEATTDKGGKAKGQVNVNTAKVDFQDPKNLKVTLGKRS